MILVDMSQVLIAALHLSYDKRFSKSGCQNFEPDLIRYFALHKLGAINSAHKGKYDKLVLACDSKHSWRKDVFQYYKGHRKKDRLKLTHIDWKAAFELFTSIKNELRTYTDYIIVEVEGAEGDDVIATLAVEYGDIPNVIVSTDKDFRQLQAYSSKLVQWDPDEEKYVTIDNPREFLENHIIGGDRGDGIPNILSDDDTFMIDEKRQKKLTTKILTNLKAKRVSDWDNQTWIRNWQRNETLIDLKNTPSEIKDAILEQFREQTLNTRKKDIFNYFFKYKQTKLLDGINRF